MYCTVNRQYGRIGNINIYFDDNVYIYRYVRLYFYLHHIQSAMLFIRSPWDTAAIPGRAANLVEDPAGKLSFKRKDSKFQCIGFLHAMICYAFKV